jgi:hypothetical protein
MVVSMSKTFKIDFDKLSKHDETMLYEIIADYVIEHELSDDVDTANWSIDYEIEVTLDE